MKDVTCFTKMWDIPCSSHVRHPIFFTFETSHFPTVWDLSNKLHLKTISVWFSQPDFFLENYLEMCLNHGNTSLAITCETSYMLHMWDTPYSSHVRHPISLTIWDIPYKLHLKSIYAWFSQPFGNLLTCVWYRNCRYELNISNLQ